MSDPSRTAHADTNTATLIRESRRPGSGFAVNAIGNGKPREICHASPDRRVFPWHGKAPARGSDGGFRVRAYEGGGCLLAALG